MDIAELQYEEPVTTQQRRALYKLLFRDHEVLKERIHMLSKQDANTIIASFIRAEGYLAEIAEHTENA